MEHILSIRIVHIMGCTATPLATAAVHQVARELGVEIDLEEILVTDQESADRYQLIGSPTVQINGLDIDPGARSLQQYGLT